jgi:putative membrane protein
MTFALLLADYGGMHDGNWGWWWIPMMLGMVFFWGAIIVGIVWLARGGFERRGAGRETPTEILDRRFAEGEISAEDYRERRHVVAKSAR